MCLQLTCMNLCMFSTGNLQGSLVPPQINPNVDWSPLARLQQKLGIDYGRDEFAEFCISMLH